MKCIPFSFSCHFFFLFFIFKKQTHTHDNLFIVIYYMKYIPRKDGNLHTSPLPSINCHVLHFSIYSTFNISRYLSLHYNSKFSEIKCMS